MQCQFVGADGVRRDCMEETDKFRVWCRMAPERRCKSDTNETCHWVAKHVLHCSSIPHTIESKDGTEEGPCHSAALSLYPVPSFLRAISPSSAL